jgi:apolipoprotein N-acyltransferase
VHQVPALTQIAELGGPILVGVVLLAANLAIAEPLLARLEKRKIDLRWVIGGAAGVLVTCLFGAWRVSSVDAMVQRSEQVQVGVVQGNMDLFQKREDPAEGLRRHRRMTDQLRQQGAEFVVWSESSVTFSVPEEIGNEMMYDRVGRHLKIPAIFGGVYYRVDPDRERWFNTALSTDASGKVNGRYDKTYLLMFGEYLPFGDTFPALYRASPHSGRFSAGTKVDPLWIETGGKKHPVTALVCYEDILPGFTNKAVAVGKPEMLINITNDRWFGDTAEPWQHLALAQFRSIEHRRFMVRSTNSGVSAIIDPVGRVVKHSGTFKPETLLHTVRWITTSTVYETVGDWPWWALSLVMAGLAFFRRPAPNRKEQPAA